MLLYTSGTTGDPKAAVLRHQQPGVLHASRPSSSPASGEDEAALVSVPPYHIAGISAVLSSLYSGRRVVYLRAFDAGGSGSTPCEPRAITHAMVVPTMLGRILDVVDGDGGRPRRRCAPSPTAAARCRSR